MKIGVLSDTHDLLRSGVLEALRGCDLILHCGDISSRKVLDRLEEIAPVRAVRGNNDGEWAEYLPAALDLTWEGLKIYMTHKKKDLPADPAPYDLMLFGHSHRYSETWTGGAGEKRTLLLNPGSCGPRRFDQQITLSYVVTGDGGWTAEQVVIPHSSGK